MNSNANARFNLQQAKEHKMATGRYVQRDNRFVSNRFKFDLDTCEAFSYDWWQFVVKIGNTIYFNDASYSMQTRLHQAMAKNVLFWEGAIEKKDYSQKRVKTIPALFNVRVVYVYYREGLNHLDTAISNMKYEITKLTEAMQKPRSHKKTNLWRAKRIEQIKREIKKTKAFKAKVDKQLALNRKERGAKEDRIWEAQQKREAIARMRAQRRYEEQKQSNLTVIQGGVL